jgi:hypothetical protein
MTIQLSGMWFDRRRRNVTGTRVSQLVLIGRVGSALAAVPVLLMLVNQRYAFVDTLIRELQQKRFSEATSHSSVAESPNSYRRPATEQSK